MGSAVLLLSLLVAMDPVRIGITALLISRPRPMRNLLAFWLGGMAAVIATALVALLLLRDFALSVMREVVSVVSGPVVAHIQVDPCASGADRGALLGAPARACAGRR
jgi:hypothetical protein